MDWYWVALPYATYGIEIRGGRVVDAAPIAWWMVGKDAQWCVNWIIGKGGRVVPLSGVSGGLGESP